MRDHVILNGGWCGACGAYVELKTQMRINQGLPNLCTKCGKLINASPKVKERQRQAEEKAEEQRKKVAEVEKQKAEWEALLGLPLEKKHKLFLAKHGLNPASLRKSFAHRTAHCYNCKQHLDNLESLECGRCNWILCTSCGACGCGYSS